MDDALKQEVLHLREENAKLKVHIFFCIFSITLPQVCKAKHLK
jgi:hypothetical protein